MSFRVKCVCAVSALLMVTSAAFAQDAKKRQQRKSQARKQAIDPRFEPTAMLDDAMIDAIVKRYAHDLSISVGMDTDTTSKVQKELEQRWVPFLQKHRHDVAPLLSRFYRAAIDPEPPSIDEVQVWAKDAMHLYDTFVEEMDACDQDVVRHLTPSQIKQYKLETGNLRMRLGLLRGQLVKWEKGDFDYSEWGRQQSDRDRRLRRESASRKDELAEKALQSDELTLVTLDAWEKYVADFISKYNLDEAQKSSANSILADVKNRASQHVKKNGDAVDKIRARMLASSPPERRKLAAEQRELLKPLEELFAELKTRLDSIPTDAQRTKASGGVKTLDPTKAGKAAARPKSKPK